MKYKNRKQSNILHQYYPLFHFLQKYCTLPIINAKLTKNSWASKK